MPTNVQATESRAIGLAPWTWKAFALPGVVWLVLLFLIPLYAVVAVAMGRLDPIFLRPIPEWNPLRWNPTAFFEVGRELFGGQLGTIAIRTIGYVAAASFLCLLIGYPVAYFVARRVQRRKALWLAALLAPFWINYLMRMMAWVNLLSSDGLVNRIMEFAGLNPQQWLEGRHSTVILGLVYGYIPFFILPLYASLDRIDQRVLEAARDLGASAGSTFRRVTLPLSRQGIMAGLVLVMLPMFGDYYTPNLLSGSPRTRMIGNQIDQFVNQTSSQGGRGAALTLILMLGVAALMLYYLFSVARATREATQ